MTLFYRNGLQMVQSIGLVATIFLCWSVNGALAGTVKVNGTKDDVSTILVIYAENSDLLESQVRWGDLSESSSKIEPAPSWARPYQE